MTTSIQSIDASTSAVLVGASEAFRFTAGGIKGATIQSAYAEYTTNADLSALIPLDDTIPQVTEGTQILSVTITPHSTTNRVRVRFQCQFQHASPSNVIAAVFVNGAANALVTEFTTNANSGGYATQLVLEKEHVPGSTAAQTYTVRIGPQSGTIRLNGSTAGRLFGGSSVATLVVEEIAV